MPSPVICIRDASIKNGQLMVKDLFPNRSLANPVIDPAPQGPRYLRVVENELPTVANGVVTKEVSGLAAYLLATIDVQGNGGNPSASQAKAMADALIAQMRAGNALGKAQINAAIQAVDGALNASGIDVGASTATVSNILQILGGAPFTVSAGLDVQGNFQSLASQALLFTVFHNPIVFEDSSFWISLAKGDLLGLKSSRTDRKGTVLDPYVVVYDSTGATI